MSPLEPVGPLHLPVPLALTLDISEPTSSASQALTQKVTMTILKIATPHFLSTFLLFSLLGLTITYHTALLLI